MTLHICIEGDATVWALSGSLDGGQLGESDKPLPIPVAGPLAGTLLLSAKAAGSVTLYTGSGVPLNPMGWIPGDAGLPFPCLYLPSVSIPAAGPVLYRLSDATLAVLADQLVAAMTAGTMITVPFGDAGTGGEVVLNGAVLPFAVISGPSAGLRSGRPPRA